MARLVFVDVDDTLLTPPYDAVRRVSTLLGKKFPGRDAFLNRPHVDYHKAFPGLFSSSAQMWAIALMSLPFGHFRSQTAMPMDTMRMGELLADHRLYLVSKNPPSFTRWRLQRLRQLFNVHLGDRYIACGPIFRKGQSKLSIIKRIAQERNVQLSDCLLIDDSVANLKDVASAGIQCAIVKSTWNVDAIDSIKALCKNLQTISSEEIPGTISSHLGQSIEHDQVAFFLVPPITILNSIRIAWTFLKRKVILGETFPSLRQILPIARNPLRSYFYKDPQQNICRHLENVVECRNPGSSVRVLPLLKLKDPMRLPVDLQTSIQAIDKDQRVRLLRTLSRELLERRGHKFVRDAMFYFTALLRPEERQRILNSHRVNKAKSEYMGSHKATQAEADLIAEKHTEELLTSRTYVSCISGEWLLDRILARIFKKIQVKTHPMVQQLEDDHFLFYAATHRSYLDSAVLWSVLSHTGQSFPFAVGADKMRKIWFGKLGLRGGTFFLRRKFIDEIYVAVIGEHMESMQKPGSVIEVFLEGQRSRSGLTLPPKKGIASIVWGNMRPNSKVAIVPVSFTYNKIPESEKLMIERLDERRKSGTLTLKEAADIKIRKSRRKTLLEKIRSKLRRVRSPLVSVCHVTFAEPILLHKNDEKWSLQNHLNQAMLRINAATAILPSSILCMFLLSTDERHSTFDHAAAFIRFSKSLIDLYELPEHLPPDSFSENAEDDVRAFMALPFINRKFKRVGLKEVGVVSLEELDTDLAAYYKNNILHFFVLPSILSYVLTQVHDGHIEELHRGFDHLFTKLQSTYFLPPVTSTRKFIDTFLALLAQRGLIALDAQRWTLSPSRSSDVLITVMARVGAEIAQGDLPNILDAIRRSSTRKGVRVSSKITSQEATTLPGTHATVLSSTGFKLQSVATARLGDRVDFVATDPAKTFSGVIVQVEDDGVTVHHPAGSSVHSAAPRDFPVTVAGTVTLVRELSGSGIIEDLSSEGAFIATTLQLKVGNPLICSLSYLNNPFKLRGRIARVTPNGVGVLFDPLSDENKARIVLLSAKPDA